jgi:hypothetical protein
MLPKIRPKFKNLEKKFTTSKNNIQYQYVKKYPERI